MKYYLTLLALLLLTKGSSAQPVKNTSYISQSGEKVLRLESLLPLSVDRAWELFSTDEGLRKWMAPVVHIELKTGGYIVTNYDKTKSLDDSTA